MPVKNQDRYAIQEAEILLKSRVGPAWRDANEAMEFYIGYRARYNLPYTSEFWADDFSLGFRDGIAHVHFHLRSPRIPDGEYAEQWKEQMPDDNGLAKLWMTLIDDGRSERAEMGTLNAFILESWRIGVEFCTGALEYISDHETRYKQKHPDCTAFQLNHWIIMSHFILPLISDDRYAHPKIVQHFSNAH